MPEDMLDWYCKLEGKLSLVDLSNELDLMTGELRSKVNSTISKAECHLDQLIECIRSIREDGPLDISIVESVKQLNLLIKKAEMDHSQLDKLEVLEDYRIKLKDAHEILTLFSNWDDLVAKIRELLSVDTNDNGVSAESEVSNEIAAMKDSDFINLLPLSTLMANIAQGYKKARKFVAKQVLSNIATIYQGYYTVFLTRLAMFVEKVLEDNMSPLDAEQFRSLYFAEADEVGMELGFFDTPQSLMKSHIFKPFKRIFHEYLSGLLSSLSEGQEFAHISSLDGYKKASFVIKVFVKFILTYIEERQAVIEGIIQASQITLHVVNSGLSELSILYLMLQTTISTPKESIEELLITYSEVTSEIVTSLSISHGDLTPFLPETIFTKYIDILGCEIEKIVSIETNGLESMSPQDNSYSRLFDSLNKYTFLCIQLCECKQDDNYIKFSEFDIKIPRLASNLFRCKLHCSFLSASNRYFGLLKDMEYEKYYTTLECIEYLILLCRVKEQLHKALNAILAFDELPCEFLSKHYATDTDRADVFDKKNYRMVVDSLEELIEKVPICIVSHAICHISKNLREYSTLSVFQVGGSNGLPTSLLSLAGESFISLIPPFTNVTAFDLPKLVFAEFVQVLIENVKKIHRLSKSGAQQLTTDLKYVAQTGSAFGLRSNQLNNLIENVEAALSGRPYGDPWLCSLTSEW